MLAYLLAVTLAATPTPRPVAPASAYLTVFVKSPHEGLPGLRGFLSESGRYAPSLRPSALGASLGGLLGCDLFDAAALEQAGVDINAPLTVSFQREGQLTCFSTKDDRPVARMKTALAGAGQITNERLRGATLTGATVGKAWRAGFATRGKKSCVASGAPDVLPLLRLATTGMDRAGIGSNKDFLSATSTLSEPVIGYFRTQEFSGAFQLAATQGRLIASGRAFLPRALLGAPQAEDALAGLHSASALVLKASVLPSALSDPAGPVGAATQFLIRNACPNCPAGTARGFLKQLAPCLSGSIALIAPRVDPTSAGIPLAGYFLFPHAYLLSVKKTTDATEALKRLLEALGEAGAELHVEQHLGEGPHLALTFGPRNVYVGFAGDALYLANDRATRDAALVALKEAKRSSTSHSLEVVLDGVLASTEIRRVGILDAPKSAELAALFALGVEGGSLLKAAGLIEGHADAKGGELGFSFTINLPRP